MIRRFAQSMTHAFLLLGLVTASGAGAWPEPEPGVGFLQRGVAPKEAFDALFDLGGARVTGRFGNKAPARLGAPAFAFSSGSSGSFSEALRFSAANLDDTVTAMSFYGNGGTVSQMTHELGPGPGPDLRIDDVRGYVLTYHGRHASTLRYAPGVEHIRIVDPTASAWGISPLPAGDGELVPYRYAEGAASVFGPDHPLVGGLPVEVHALVDDPYPPELARRWAAPIDAPLAPSPRGNRSLRGGRLLSGSLDIVGTAATAAHAYEHSGARGLTQAAGVAAGAGAAQYGLSVAGNHLAKTAGRSIAKKAAGKVVARFIPGVGHAMTVWDAGWNWNAYLSDDVSKMEERVTADPMTWVLYKAFMWGQSDPLE